MDIIDPTSVIQAVEPWIGNCLFFETIDSTHAFALRLMDQIEEDDTRLRPTLVCAGDQTVGMGRAGRRWISERGGLYFNLLGSLDNPDRAAVLSILAAAAARRSLAAVGCGDAGIKWPNDILVDGRKIAGLLVHVRHGNRAKATIGVGVNLLVTPSIDPPPLRPPTSVTAEIGAGDDTARATTIIRTFIDHLVRGLSHPDEVIADWRHHLVHRRGEPMEVMTGDGTLHRGSFAGVTADGHLRLATADGAITVASGDVV